MTSPKPCPDMPTEIWAIPYPFSEWRHTSEQACHVARMDGCGNPTKYVRADLAAPSQWQTIDSAPRDGTPYLAWADGREVVYTWWAEVESCLGQKKMGYKTLNGFWANFGACINPTHWMPLPQPPAAEVDKE